MTLASDGQVKAVVPYGVSSVTDSGPGIFTGETGPGPAVIAGGGESLP